MGRPGFFADVCERPVAEVFEEDVGTQIGHVEVLISVVVEVSGRTAHTPTRITGSGLCRHVLEMIIPQILEEVIMETCRV